MKKYANNQPTISVIVTTYNWTEALYCVLDSLDCQDYLDFEVIIADDGSTYSTRQLIEKFQKRFSHPLHHVWQTDLGFRAAAIRNKAIAKANGNYIVFLDGDCIPSSTFLSRHAKLSEQNCFVAGNRILLSKRYTEGILSNNIDIKQHTILRWVWLFLTRKINRIMPLLTLPDSKWRHKNNTKWEGAITCNLAAWQNDLMSINGFNEDYQGWGMEDSDLAIRLINSGKHRKEGRYATGVFHLWHATNDRSDIDKNMSLLNKTIRSTKTYITNGIVQS